MMSEDIFQWNSEEDKWTSLSAQAGSYSFAIHDSSNSGMFVWTVFHEFEKAALYGGESEAIETAKAACLHWLNDPIHAFVIETSFEISERGTAVMFDGIGSGLPVGRRLKAIIRRPDGSSIEAETTMELVLQSSEERKERPAFLIYGIGENEVVPDSQIEIYPKSVT